MRQEKSAKVSEAAKVGDQHKWTARQIQRRNIYLRRKEAMVKADDCIGSAQRPCPTSAASSHKVADSVGVDDRSHRNQCATNGSNGTSLPELGQEKSEKVSEAAKVGDQHKWTARQLERRNIYLRQKEAILKGVIGLGATVACLQADDCVGSAQRPCPTSAASYLKVADSVGIDDHSHRKQCAAKASDGTSFPGPVQTNAKASLSEIADPGIIGRGMSSPKRKSTGATSTTNCLTDHVKLGSDTHCRKRESPEMMSIKDPLPEMGQEKSAKVLEAAKVGDQGVAGIGALVASRVQGLQAADDGVKIPQQLCPTSAASDLKVADSVGVGDRSHIEKAFEGISFRVTAKDQRCLYDKNRYLRKQEGRLNGVAGVGAPVASRVQELNFGQKCGKKNRLTFQKLQKWVTSITVSIIAGTARQLHRRNIYLRHKEAISRGVVGLGATVSCLQADDCVGSSQRPCPTSAASILKVADSVGVDYRSHRKQCATKASDGTSFPVPVQTNAKAGLSEISDSGITGRRSSSPKRKSPGMASTTNCLTDHVKLGCGVHSKKRKSPEKMSTTDPLPAMQEKSPKVSEAAKMGDQGVAGVGAPVASREQGLQVNAAADDDVKIPQQLCPTSAASDLKVADSVGVGDCSHMKQSGQQLCPTSAASDLKVADSVGVGDCSHMKQSVPVQTNENASFSEMSDAGISGRDARSRKRKSPEDIATEQSDQIEHSEIIDKETQVCEILENLSNLIQKTESDDSEIVWKVRRKRSKTRLRPSRCNLLWLEKRVKVAYGNPSPTSPFYICDSVFITRAKGFAKKFPKRS